jgi:putative membrane protein
VSAAPKNQSARAGAIVALLAGLAGAAYLIARLGFHAIAGAALSVGWSGLALLCLYGLANFVLLGFAWFSLLRPLAIQRALTFCWGRAVRDSVGDVLPFSQLGGMAIGARAVSLRGVSAPLAFASTVVDVTVEMIAQIVFVLTGLAILLVRLPAFRSSGFMEAAALGLAVAIVLAAAFIVAQRRGFSILERWTCWLLPAAAVYARELDRAVNRIHAHPLPLVGGFALHLLGWFSAAFGLWLALQLIDRPLPFFDAVAIESLLCALRSATVFVPTAIGVQEAGYAVMMPLFGLPAEIGVAVSLLKRAREVCLAIPVLFSWQWAEGRRAFRAATPSDLEGQPL